MSAPGGISPGGQSPARPARLARPIRIIDCTLREGVQAAGADFDAAGTAEITRLLVRCGVDMIECGHAAISGTERDRIRAAVAAAGDVPLLVHSRAYPGDVDAVVETGASWAGIFLGLNEHTRRSRVRGASTDDLLGMIDESVSYATGHGLRVRFTVEDASRTEQETLLRAYEVAVAAGARRLCFADTVGIMEPAVAGAAAWLLRDRFPDHELEFHLHDDRGLALANALAALDSGADWISCSVNGLGERAGITSLFVLLANLHHRGTRPLADTAALHRVSELVRALSRVPVDPQRPVVGRHAFTHVSRLHQRAVAVDTMSYSWIPPAELGTSTLTASPRPWTLTDLVIEPEIRSATELRHHRHGPGDRYLLIDERKLADCRQYCIMRRIPEGDPGPGHVDEHRHNVDSTFFFLGSAPDFTGLRVHVRVGEEESELESPTTVFIPAGVCHTYRVLGGSGLFFNLVLAGTYEEGLLE